MSKNENIKINKINSKSTFKYLSKKMVIQNILSQSCILDLMFLN